MSKDLIIARDRLVELSEENNGQITTSLVLKDAKRKESPLHDYFEWDDTKAAHQHRLQQARMLIKRVNVVIFKPEEQFIHVPKFKQKGEGAYKPIKTVVKSSTEYELAKQEAEKRLNAAQEALSNLIRVASKSKQAPVRKAAKLLETARETLTG